MFEIPQNIKQSLDMYATNHIEPGGFLRAVLENDLMRAVGSADYINKNLLPEICSYVYNEMPASCHGSKEIVQQWLDNNNS